MTSLMFSLAGLINAIFARNFDDISIIPTFVLTPLIYLGGVFYSIDMLGEFWGGVSQINPILYMVNAFRYGIAGISDINIVWAFTMVQSVLRAAVCRSAESAGQRLEVAQLMADYSNTELGKDTVYSTSYDPCTAGSDSPSHGS